jgi:hypothetical protein
MYVVRRPEGKAHADTRRGSKKTYSLAAPLYFVKIVIPKSVHTNQYMYFHHYSYL